MKPVVSPKDLAYAIGVSESSIKRWVDDGLIVATKTSGGHRRIAIDEVLRFIRQSQTPIVHPDVLGLPPEASSSAQDVPVEKTDENLLQALLTGDAPRARGLLLSLYLRGHSVASICDGPLSAAMSKIGELWKHRNGDGIFLEHRASDICIQALSRIRSMFEPPADGAVAIGGAPPGDSHLLSSLATSVVLASDGFRAINLGPDTPIHSFLTAVETHKPTFVWVSISIAQNPRTLSSQMAQLASELQSLGVHLALGGVAAGEVKISPDRGVFVGRSMMELVAFATGLNLSGGIH
ncbi:MAG: helix-turn-helix domain-containing protein [Phycisphaerae bacterium]|nr:helix-turn-helix domain-containing protein [Phycisphaerae bacterium]